MRRRSLLCCIFAITLGLFVTLAAHGQSGFDINQLQLPDELNELNLGGPPSHGIKVTSQVILDPKSNTGLLTVELTMDGAWKVYSTTQAKGGPPATKIHLDPSSNYRLLGTLAPSSPPKVEHSKEFRMNVESFGKKVTWSVPIEITQNVAPGLALVTGYVEGLACANQCVRFGKETTQFQATVVSASNGLLPGTKLKNTHANVRMWIANAQVAPGGTTQLFVAFEPDPNWHVYAYSKQPIQFQSPTLAHVELPSGWKQGVARSASKIISKVILEGDPPIREYLGPATIAIPIEVPTDAKVGTYPVSGKIAFQTCSDHCDQPTAFAWAGQVEVAASASSVSRGVSIREDRIPYADVARELTSTNGKSTRSVPVIKDNISRSMATASPVLSDAVPPTNSQTNSQTASAISRSGQFDLSNVDFAGQQSDTSLVWALVMAVAGGFILNFMPCVLPVIGLKVMSFVDQAGADRRKVFTLNAVYVLGILSIFWVLAAMSLAGIGWGSQFNNRIFLVSLISLVFTMALSFFGVWEIPIPGFATSQKATKLTESEGLSGAFFKGAITTLLATPCGAPFFGVAYGFAVQSRSPVIAFLIFTFVGLGMGLPYLLIGAFPSSIKFLPKPGAWMETFKQAMGFILLGTVVYLMQSLQFTDILPVVGLLFGLWFACWWIGRIPFTAPKPVRTRGWAVAFMIGIAAVAVSFSEKGLLGHSNQNYTRAITQKVLDAAKTKDVVITNHPVSGNHLPWEPYDEAKMNSMLQNGETVLVDFTASWCPNCRLLEATVLNTKPVKDLVAQNGIRTVVADLGTEDPAMIDLLVRLQGHNTIPFLAVFPAGKPEQVKRFPGLYSSSRLIGALESAGKSAAHVASLPARPAPSRPRPAKSILRTQQLP